MGFDWGTLGMQAAGQALGAGMGIILGNHNDKRQIAQQEKLQKMQEQGNMRMMDYASQKQYEMWLKTNYSAQREQIEEAGLNAALLYGGGGGGGATTGNASGNVSAGSAPTGGGEIQAAMGMGMQLAQQNAQIKLTEAQTKNVEADTAKKSGVDTENVAMSTEKLFQEWQNLKKTHDLQELEISMKNIENFEKQTTQGNRLKYIQYQTETALHNLKIVANENKISDETVKDQIKTIKAEAIGAVLKNYLTKAQTDKTKSDIIVNQEQIRKWSHEIMLGWDTLETKNTELLLKRLGVNDESGISESIDKILKIVF